MYVARQPLNLRDRKALPGDPVPEASEWTHPVLQAHLRLGWIEKVEEPAASVHPGEVAREKPKKKTKKKTA